MRARTLVSEIAGSESFIHVEYGTARWVCLAHGIHDIDPDREIDVFIDTRHLMAFGAVGKALDAEDFLRGTPLAKGTVIA